MSQVSLARRVDVSEHWLGRCINGRDAPSHDLATRVAAALGEPVESLWRLDDLSQEPLPRHPGNERLEVGA